MKNPLHLHIEIKPGSAEEFQDLWSVKTSVQIMHKHFVSEKWQISTAEAQKSWSRAGIKAVSDFQKVKQSDQQMGSAASSVVRQPSIPLWLLKPPETTALGHPECWAAPRSGIYPPPQQKQITEKYCWQGMRWKNQSWLFCSSQWSFPSTAGRAQCPRERQESRTPLP